MKRILAIIMLLATLLSLAACGRAPVEQTVPTVPKQEKPKVIYEKLNYDGYNFKNQVYIDQVDIQDDTMQISYTVVSQNGGSYSAFATDAVFYDVDNNIIGITQVMLRSEIGKEIGQSFRDVVTIPDATKTILISSGGKNTQFLVSANHGNPAVQVEIPDVCYDNNGYGHSVNVNSYNIHDGKIFLTYTVRGFEGSQDRDHASEMIFYDAEGTVLDVTQALFATNLDHDSIGLTYFDFHSIPDGTAKIVVQSGNGLGKRELKPVDVTVTGSDVMLRRGPGKNYESLGFAQKGDKKQITQTKLEGGCLWGKSESGWLALEFTDYVPVRNESTHQPETENSDGPIAPLEVIILCEDVSIRSGPGTQYETIGVAIANTIKVITEIKFADGYLWGRAEDEWFALEFTNYDLVKDSGLVVSKEPAMDPVIVTVTGDDVSLRKGPGTNYYINKTAQKGERRKITDLGFGTGCWWGKTTDGWIALDFTNYKQVTNQGGTTTPEVKPTEPQPTTPTQPDTTIDVWYKTYTYDHRNYGNMAAIDRVDVNNNKLFVTYTIREHNGGSFDVFATNAVFYDANNNILDISQIMYTRNVGNSIGQTYVDDCYIPKNTKTILISSTTKNESYLVSSDHGNTNIKLEIPSVCYDSYGYGNEVTINSYNVYDSKLFLTFTATAHRGGSFDSHATDIVFYNASGSVLDTSQALYISNLDNNGVGLTYFDYHHIPKGTARIVIKTGPKPSGGNTTPTEPKPTEPKPTEPKPTEPKPTQPSPEQWTYADVNTLDGYITSVNEGLNKAKSYCNKGLDEYYVLAYSQTKLSAKYAKLAIELLESKSAVKLTNGTTLLELVENMYDGMMELNDVNITLDNVRDYQYSISECIYTALYELTSIEKIIGQMREEF